jgi:hypothetical protein
MTVTIPAQPDMIILSVEYAPNGLDWARLYDNPVLPDQTGNTDRGPTKPVC